MHEVIKTLTKECDGDCSLIVESQCTTLAHIPDVYDKHGNPKPHPDPNMTETKYRCLVCHRFWMVRFRGGQPEIVAHMKLGRKAPIA